MPERAARLRSEERELEAVRTSRCAKRSGPRRVPRRSFRSQLQSMQGEIRWLSPVALVESIEAGELA
jgi:hypothetical protein